jgi:hypothetical protein
MYYIGADSKTGQIRACSDGTIAYWSNKSVLRKPPTNSDKDFDGIRTGDFEDGPVKGTHQGFFDYCRKNSLNAINLARNPL